MSIVSSYKKEFNLEKRRTESSRIRAKHYNYIPVIVEGSKHIKSLDKRKYLVPNNFTVGQFIYVIRKRLEISPEKAIFIFVGNKIPNVSDQICNLYENDKDEDGFLYMKYTFENTFG